MVLLIIDLNLILLMYSNHSEQGKNLNSPYSYIKTTKFFLSGDF